MRAPKPRAPSVSLSGTFPRIPNRCTFPACCASAASGGVRRPPARLPRNARRVTIASAHRQREGEGGPPARLALDPDLAAVQLDKLLREGQPEARPFLLACLVVANLAELLEDRRLVLGGNPDPRIADCDLDCSIREPGLEADPAPFRGELDRVGEEVEQDLLDLALVPHHLAQPGVDV